MFKYLIVFLTLLCPFVLSAEEIDGFEVEPGSVIVKFFHDPDPALGAESLGNSGIHVVKSKKHSTADLIEILKKNPNVEYVEPDYIVEVDIGPNDPYYTNGTLWGMFDVSSPYADINVYPAWATTTGSDTVHVGVIDTGIDYTHPDLAANVWSAPSSFTVNLGTATITCPAGTHGFNAITNTCDPMDDHYHGTHVSGTIGGVGNNGVGVAGVNWQTSMIGCKFLSATGSGSSSNAVKCLDAYDQLKAIFGIEIVATSNSWGGGSFLQSMLDAINRSGVNGTMFVAAAGNSARDNDITPHYPSSYNSSYVVSVASHTSSNALSSFSNWGANSVDLSAPGSSIMSTRPANTYGSLSGTSMATPHVSGVLALMASVCTQDAPTLVQAMYDTVVPESYLAGRTTTGGRVDAGAALAKCLGTPPPPPEPTPPPAPGCSLVISGKGSPLKPGYAKVYSVFVNSTLPVALSVNSILGLKTYFLGTDLYVENVNAAPGTYMLTVTGHNAAFVEDCTDDVAVKVQGTKGRSSGFGAAKKAI